MRKLDQEKLERLIRLRERGWGYRSIASDLGVSAGCVHYHCLKRGVTSPHQTGRRDDTKARTFRGKDGRTFRPFTRDEDLRMTEMSVAGRKMDAIARDLGRARTSVRIRLMTLALHEELRS